MKQAGNGSDHRYSAGAAVVVSPGHNQPLHSIQVVARRTGLSAGVIRAWERRYEAVSPGRSETNRRFYSDIDVERLLLLHQAIRAGRRIGDIARLSSAELAALVSADSIAQQGSTQPGPAADAPSPPVAADTHLTACLEAVERLDVLALEQALSKAMVALSVPLLLETVVYRLMETVGAQWRSGTMRLCHEHLATAVVRSFLGGMISISHMAAGSGPVVIVTTPAGQRHELGALMVAVTAASRGWDPLYLGANMPSEEIAFAADTRAVQAVALSICYPADDPALHQQLHKLRQQLAPGTPILAGGKSAIGYRQVLDDIAALRPTGLYGLALELDKLR